MELIPTSEEQHYNRSGYISCKQKQKQIEEGKCEVTLGPATKASKGSITTAPLIHLGSK
jgi:hypothetical protein